jgi:response regulator RpfG family c-di-GMP phosphodiesterase
MPFHSACHPLSVSIPPTLQPRKNSNDKTNKDNKQLLLIDDDPNLILLVKDYLEFRGYRVTTAETVGKATRNPRNAVGKCG